MTFPGGAPPADGGQQKGAVRIEDLRRNALIEVDPQSDFEAFVKAQAVRCAAGGDSVFVFTSEGSPLHRLLDGTAGVSLILMSVDSDAVRRSSGEPGRVSLLDLDKAHILTLLDSRMAKEGRVHVFLDSFSSMAMALGFQDAYKLLRQSIEIVGRSAGPRINAFVVMIRGTQSEAEVNTFRSMFQVILTYDSSGLKVLKPPDLKLMWDRTERAGSGPRQGDRGGRKGFFGSLTRRGGQGRSN